MRHGRSRWQEACDVYLQACWLYRDDPCELHGRAMVLAAHELDLVEASELAAMGAARLAGDRGPDIIRRHTLTSRSGRAS